MLTMKLTENDILNDNSADDEDDEDEIKAVVAEQDYLQDFSIPPLCGR